MKKLQILIIWMSLSSWMCGCASHPARTTMVPIDEEQVLNADLKAVDLRSIANAMARSIAQNPRIQQRGGVVRIAFDKCDDATGQTVDGKNLQDHIRTLLVGNSTDQLIFLDRSPAAVKRIMAENRLKNNGTVTGAAGTLAGADMFLNGRIYELTENDRHALARYYRASFWLTDANTLEVIWEDQYELKRLD